MIMPTCIKKCSRELLCFAPMNEYESPQNTKARSAFFYNVFQYFIC